jgi:uncharacterized protein YaiL (DUF2058 family)
MSKQKLSLQEQLLKSGLVSSAKAKTAKSDKHKQVQLQRKNNVTVVDEAKQQALRVQAEKAERDRELNELHQQQETQKALAAQVRQLIGAHRQAQDAEGVAYRFSDGNKVKTLYVSETLRESVIKGRSAVVKFDGVYEVVAADVAQKIKARDAGCVVVENPPEAEAADKADDPYAAYQIPDDLVW